MIEVDEEDGPGPTPGEPLPPHRHVLVIKADGVMDDFHACEFRIDQGFLYVFSRTDTGCEAVYSPGGWQSVRLSDPGLVVPQG